MIKIATVSEDEAGNEIIASAKKVLSATADLFGFEIEFSEAVAGKAAIDMFGRPLPDKSLAICKSADSVLLGSHGESNPISRPESAIAGIRKVLRHYANIRRVVLYPELSDASPLKKEITSQGCDIIIVNELTGGIYFGDSGYRYGKFGREAYNTEVYSEIEIERIARIAYEIAEKRTKKLCSVDKADALESSRLWRKIVNDVNEDYPTVQLTDMLIDNAAAQLVENPSQFDVIVTSNMFGDILSDLAGACVGSIGMSSNASLGDTLCGLYESGRRGAPNIFEADTVNPIGIIMSAATMLKMSCNKQLAAESIENAVRKTISDGYRTADIAICRDEAVSTTKITDVIIKNLKKIKNNF